MIVARDVRVVRGRQAVVHDVSLRVESGSWLTLVGPNGAGKSSLLLALAGLVPSSGSITVEHGHDRALADSVLSRVDLAWASDRLVATLSGGEFRRAVVGRALAQEARTLILDEPTTGLDLGHQLQVLDLVEELRRGEGITVVSAMHDLTLAARYADTIALMADGQIAIQGTPHDVLRADVLERHYGVPVHVLHGPDGEVIVAPAAVARP
jgi:iron complex transport system ATP-binding protein